MSTPQRTRVPFVSIFATLGYATVGGHSWWISEEFLLIGFWLGDLLFALWAQRQWQTTAELELDTQLAAARIQAEGRVDAARVASGFDSERLASIAKELQALAGPAMGDEGDEGDEDGETELCD